jgi:hypothetical protein
MKMFVLAFAMVRRRKPPRDRVVRGGQSLVDSVGGR